MLKRVARYLLLSISLVVTMHGVVAHAASDSSIQYWQGKIVGEEAPTAANPQELLKVQFLNGDKHGQTLLMPATGLNSATDITLPTYRANDIVVVSATMVDGFPPQYAVIDHYRLPAAGWIFVVVVLLAILFAGRRGAGSIVGLCISLAVVGGFIVPQILHGANPYAVTLAGCFAISAMGIFVAHGFSCRTGLALLATYATLLIAAILSAVAIGVVRLNGIATEDAAYLHQQMPFLNIQGVLLAGIMIGVLGVLDDITVGQAAAVDEIRRANSKLSWRELYERGIHVGREHISSLINTLVLAYAGSSFVFVVYVAAVLNLPIWLTLNSELVMEEVVRSLVGSFALILAVPIATFLSAYFLSRPPRHTAAACSK